MAEIELFRGVEIRPISPEELIKPKCRFEGEAYKPLRYSA
jgi:hypothetical protein